MFGVRKYRMTFHYLPFHFRFQTLKTWKSTTASVRYRATIFDYFPILFTSTVKEYPLPSRVTTPLFSISGAHAGRHGKDWKVHGKVQYISLVYMKKPQFSIISVIFQVYAKANHPLPFQYIAPFISTSSFLAGRLRKDMEKCNISADIRDRATIFNCIPYLYTSANTEHSIVSQFITPFTSNSSFHAGRHEKDMKKCNISAGVLDKARLFGFGYVPHFSRLQLQNAHCRLRLLIFLIFASHAGRHGKHGRVQYLSRCT
jgi:hypothetical protein